jgi:signal transduction histidine kinase
MIANIAHQWRQPLSVISTIATGIKMQIEFNMLDTTKLLDNCETINNNAQYLSKTIEDFRNFIKGDAKLEHIRSHTLFEMFFSLIKPTIKTNNITFIKNIDDFNIYTSSNELNQCLINIFNNSKDILQTKNEEDRIFIINFKKEDNKFVITTQDSGGGIPDEIIDKIFEPYFTTKHKAQGIGLGLSMTYNLITQALKGSVEVLNDKFEYNNKQYIGAKFIITLQQ